MTEPHVFRIEVQAVPHREHKNDRAVQGWKHSVENAIATALLYEKGSFSAIVRVIDPTPGVRGES